MRAALSLVLSIATVAGDARAQPAAEVLCPAVAGGSAALASIDPELRLRSIDEGVRLGARHAREWAWTWAGLYTTTATVNLIRTVYASPEERKDGAVAVVAPLIGVAALAFLPLKVMGDERRLARLRGDGWSSGDRCARLAEVERLLLRDAASEAFGHGPLVHVGNFAINIALGVILGLGFGHWTAGAITMLTGIAVGEIQSITQPSDSVALLARYRAADLSARSPSGTWRVGASGSRSGWLLDLSRTF